MFGKALAFTLQQTGVPLETTKAFGESPHQSHRDVFGQVVPGRHLSVVSSQWGEVGGWASEVRFFLSFFAWNGWNTWVCLR